MRDMSADYFIVGNRNNSLLLLFNIMTTFMLHNNKLENLRLCKLLLTLFKLLIMYTKKNPPKAPY